MPKVEWGSRPFSAVHCSCTFSLMILGEGLETCCRVAPIGAVDSWENVNRTAGDTLFLQMDLMFKPRHYQGNMAANMSTSVIPETRALKNEWKPNTVVAHKNHQIGLLFSVFLSGWLTSCLLCACMCCVWAPYDSEIDKSLVADVMAAQHAADADPEVRWLGEATRICWPYINLYIKDLVRNIIQPTISNALPRMLSCVVVFGEVSLGDARPVFGPIVVRERGKESAVIDVDINLDMDISFSVSGLGVRRVVLSGRVSVVFRPLKPSPPFFSAIEVYFTNPPKLDILFGVTGQAITLGGLHGIVRAAISDAINRFLVLPARVAIDIDHDQIDLADVKFPEPVGILRLTINSAQARRVGSCGSVSDLDSVKSKSTYVIIRAGQDVLKATLSGNNTVDLVIYDQAQVCNFSMFDERWGRDEFIGESFDVSLESLRNSRKADTGDVSLALHNGGTRCGSLKVAARWLELIVPSAAKGPEQLTNSSFSRSLTSFTRPMAHGSPFQLILFSKLLNLRGVTADHCPPFLVHVAVGNQWKVTSRASRPRGGVWVRSMKRDICEKLAEKGMLSKDIGEVLSLETALVEHVVEVSKEPDPAAKQRLQNEFRKEVNAQQALEDPVWEEIVKIFLPWDAAVANALVTLELRDKDGRLIGDRVSCAVAEIIAHAAGEFQGPFYFSDTVCLEGNLRMKWINSA